MKFFPLWIAVGAALIAGCNPPPPVQPAPAAPPYTVKPGDKVTIDMAPLRDGKKGGALKKVTLVDTGKFLTADIRAQERANLEQEAPAK